MSETSRSVSPSPAEDGLDQDGSIRRLFFRVFPSLMLPMFLGVIDQTIVAASLPAISSSLGDVEQISWVVIGYLISNTVAAPVYGRLGDVYGRRRMMLVAISVMVAASGLCAASDSLSMLILARMVQGLGGGGLMTLAQSLIGEAVPPRARARYQGYIAAVVVTSNALGPVLGGYLTEAFGWRSVFLINLPLGIGAALTMLRLPDRVPSHNGFRFDYRGLFWFVLFVVPLLLALFRIEHQAALTLSVLGLCLVSVFSLIMLLRNERRAETPLLPVSVLRRPSIWRCDAMAACHGAGLVSLITFIPIYMRVVRGASASEMGMLLLPLAMGVGIGSLITGRLVGRTGRTMVFPSLALIPAVMLLAGFAFVHRTIPIGAVSILFGVLALLMGSVMNVVQVVVQDAAGREMLGAAAGSVQFSRSVGAAFGTALVSMVFFLLLSSGGVASSHFSALLAQGPAALSGMSDALPLMHAVTTGFRYAFLVIAGFILMTMLFAWSVPERRLA